jgi:microcystin-dependent protein
MAQQAQQVNISQLPPASLLYNGDVFAIDQIGGDGYTKKVSFETLYKSVSSIILPDLYATKVSIAGSTMTGGLILSGAPTVALQAATKQYVDDSVTFTLDTVYSNYVSKAGSTMTGALTLFGNPTSNLHAATKQYVDTLFSSISGSTLIPLVPPGSIIWYSGNAAPAGYLVCNGDVIPDGSGTVQDVTANFAALFAVVGSTYGNAGQLPDMRGLFARGWDAAGGSSKNIDASRTFGSVQNASLIGFDEKNDAVWNVSTTQDNPTNSAAALSLDALTQANLLSDYLPSGTTAANAPARLTGVNNTSTLNPFTTGPTTTQGWAGGARPRNIALLPCIKY